MTLPIYGLSKALSGGVQGYREGVQFEQQRQAGEMQNEAGKINLEDLKNDQGYKVAAKELNAALGPLAIGGDTTQLTNWYNAHSKSGTTIKSIDRGQDGQFQVQMGDGKPGPMFKNIDELAMKAFSILDPKTYLQEKLKNQKADKEEYVTDPQGNLYFAKGADASAVNVAGKGLNVGPGGLGRGKGGADTRPREVKIAEWLVSSGIEVDRGKAFDRAMRSRENPQQFAAGMYQKALIARDKQYQYDEDNVDRPTDDELFDSVTQSVKKAWGTDFSATKPKPGAQSPAAGGIKSPDGAGVKPPGGALKKAYTGPDGVTVTSQQVEATAKNRGMTTDQVIKALGLK